MLVSTRFPPYERAVSVQHWQLRDLVHAASGQDVYVAGETSTIHYSIARRSSTTVQELSFSPYALACGFGYVAAAGSTSELQVTCLASSTSILCGGVGGAANNALHFSQASGQLELFVSNNDATVKIFGLSDHQSMIRSGTVRCGSAVNHCALSPDGRALCCVGDVEQTTLFQPTPAGYLEVQSWQEASDAGMSCAWSPNARCVASAHQDGTVIVWDARAQRALHKYTLPGAARNVKFCSGSAMDLMAVAEHEGFVHVVDTRRWDQMQRVAVANTGCGNTEIAGLSFDPQGEQLFVGLDERVLAFEINAALRHSFASGALL